jgi:glycine/D-amino acid oxidase-like deaminating enzyme
MIKGDTRSTAYDVIVVGAGIVGAACAAECVRQGMRLAVVDGAAIASNATSAGMGHIVVMDDSEPQFALTRYSQELWQALRADLPVDVECEQRGTIWVAADEQEMAEVRRKQYSYSQRGVPVTILDREDVEAAEPNLRKGLAGGLLVPEDIVLNPPCAARFLIERACAGGASVLVGHPVTEIGNGRVLLSSGEELFAGALINAGGNGAASLMPGLAVKKRKGHLTITDPYPGFIHHQLVELGYLKSAHSTPGDSVAFNVQPRKNGQVVVGSSRQYDVEGGEVDDAILLRMINRAAEYLPKLSKMSKVRVWTGFRPATPDNLPLIGPWPGDSTLFVAAGHEGLGITTSLATGRILADQIAGKKSAIPIEPYLPSRMSVERVHV